MTALSLASFAAGYRALVFGSTGGIGAALTRALAADPRCAQVYAAARHPAAARRGVTPLAFSLEDEASIAAAVAGAAADGPIDLVVVATGVLHAAALQPEKSWRAIDATAFEQALRINTIGPALIAKHALAHLPRDRKAAFAVLSARVGSISDNRLGGWHAYRASKAALNMLVRTWAIELALRHPQAVCVALHPGTVATGLSAPFQRHIPAGQLLSPEQSAAALLGVMERLNAEDSGKLFAWDGTEIPF
ncbi:MAG: hypothetical protein RLZZ84_34 [Pseudomonadota bacterium]|jgi:NAD(P)-dependent dehydrogenase (short-subunit alcohol dehydrogenase family)